MLYRIFQNKLHGEVRQIVVPEVYQKQVMKLAHESIVGGHLGAKKNTQQLISCILFCDFCEVIRK